MYTCVNHIRTLPNTAARGLAHAPRNDSAAGAEVTVKVSQNWSQRKRTIVARSGHVYTLTAKVLGRSAHVRYPGLRWPLLQRASAFRQLQPLPSVYSRCELTI